MCGFAGTINYPLNGSAVEKSMFHRGPDEQNGFSAGNVNFYHLRLSILDAAGGKQPMESEGRYAIVYNGQIYNHLELRKTHRLNCKTNSDTETLLQLYIKYGSQMLNLLDGMFAFCVYDKELSKLFFARDRAGEKPLYIFNDKKKLIFASELNCLKSIFKPDIDLENFASYARLGVFYRKFTPYKNVTEIEPGTSIEIDINSLEEKKNRWFNIHEYYLKQNNDSFEIASGNIEHILQKSIKSRIESSDLEVGSFLSGGIDSGLVTSIAAGINPSIKTFTVAFDGAYNEIPLARLVAEKYQTNHTEISISYDDLINDVEKIIGNYGEPYFDSSAIPSYYVSREAKKYVTVILNGDGADEMFAGYRRYVPFAKFDFFKTNKFRRSLTSAALKFLPTPTDKKSKYNFLYRLTDLASKSGLETYLSAGIDVVEGFEQYIIPQSTADMQDMRNLYNTIVSADISGLKKLMNLDFDINLVSDLLVKMDIATMANSLEGRSPFLCKEILEYCPSLKDDFKIKGTTTKYILREIARKYLPAQLIDEPKRGFEVPLKNWVNGVLKDMLADYILSPSAFNPLIIKKSFTIKLLENKINIPAEKRAKILWMIFCMEVWYKKNNIY